MPPTPFRKPPPAEADLDRLHRVLTPSTAPPPWPEPLDAPFLDVLPDVAPRRAARQFLPLDPADLDDPQARVPPSPPTGPQVMRLATAALDAALPMATSHGVLRVPTTATNAVLGASLPAVPTEPRSRLSPRLSASGTMPPVPTEARSGLSPRLSASGTMPRVPADTAMRPGSAGSAMPTGPADIGTPMLRAAAGLPDMAVSSVEADVPSALPGRSAFDPGRRGMRALAAVAALVVALAAYLAWQARPSVEPAPEPVPVPVAASGRPVPASAPAMLVVAVTGRVRKAGLVRLAPGARVADAIEAAGGVLPDTDLSAVNLARKVTDGELIAIGVPGAAAAEGPAAGAGPGAGPVNLNTATLAQLDALPGVGPVLAQRILDHRAKHGDFRSAGDLRQVEGIGDAKFAQLKDLVTV